MAIIDQPSEHQQIGRLLPIFQTFQGWIFQGCGEGGRREVFFECGWEYEIPFLLDQQPFAVQRYGDGGVVVRR